MASFASNMFGSGGISAFSNGLNSFIHPEDAYKAAEDQSQQYYRDAQGRLQPYNQNGMDQYGRLMDQAGKLNDPVALENQWASQYTESPEAKQDIANATSSGLGAASSMGLNGSSAAIRNIQNSSGELMNKDRQGFLDRAMAKYMASIGIGQGLYGIGANAAGAQSSNAMSEGNTMAGLKYGETAAPGAMFGDLLGKGVNLAANYFTGGMSGLAQGAAGMTGGGGNSGNGYNYATGGTGR